MAEPIKLEAMKRSKPNLKTILPDLGQDNKWDLRCKVKPMDCVAEVNTPIITPMRISEVIVLPLLLLCLFV
ncbi:hypothetical protein WICPIJ_002286 [Wickerhamomyces pijperi]|uniref:Uncharacterized protein n=1 Tax=Wickerhamomyces pijperi TaxID=599730 RepID=A0A9P8QA02_WICPI|nr:hypothetical protein WICPIJ_002286 [Wickerhamomyces pijperi]